MPQVKKKKREEYEEYDEFYDDLFFFIDRAVSTLYRRLIASFGKLKNIESEEEIIRRVAEVYVEVDDTTRRYLLMIAKKVYKEVADYFELECDVNFITELWVLLILEDYDPITKYVYVHEVDRKRARLVEAMIASKDKAKEVDNGLKAWSKQAKQYADNVADKAIEDLFENNNVERVMWVTERDSKVCNDCDELDGSVYPLDSVPSKPHYGCRCYKVPV